MYGICFADAILVHPRVPHGPKLDAALTKPNVNATVKPALCGLVSRPLSHVANLKLTYVYFQYFYNLHGPGSSISIVRKRNQLFLPKNRLFKTVNTGIFSRWISTSAWWELTVYICKYLTKMKVQTNQFIFTSDKIKFWKLKITFIIIYYLSYIK